MCFLHISTLNAEDQELHGFALVKRKKEIPLEQGWLCLQSSLPHWSGWGDTDFCWSGAQAGKDTGTTDGQTQLGLVFNELMQLVFSKGSQPATISLMLTQQQHQNSLLIKEEKLSGKAAANSRVWTHAAGEMRNC